MEQSAAQRDAIPLGLDAMYLEFSDMVYRLALLRTRSRADAEDVLQEVFFRCMRRNPDFASYEHQRAWLITATVNYSKTLLNTAFRRHNAGDVALLALLAEDTGGRELYDLIAALPEKQKIAFHLHYAEGYSLAEIAAMLHSKESTVKSWLFRARQTLQKQWKEAETI